LGGKVRTEKVVGIHKRDGRKGGTFLRRTVSSGEILVYLGGKRREWRGGRRPQGKKMGGLREYGSDLGGRCSQKENIGQYTVLLLSASCRRWWTK